MPNEEIHSLRWVFPRDLEEDQIVAVYVQGHAIYPYFAHHGDGKANYGTFYQDKVQRITDDNGDLIAVQIGFYQIPDYLLDHPRVTAMIED